MDSNLLAAAVGKQRLFRGLILFIMYPCHKRQLLHSHSMQQLEAHSFNGSAFFPAHLQSSRTAPQRYPQELVCVLPASHNEGPLYLGNLEAAQNTSRLRRLGIEGVLTIAREANLQQDLRAAGIANLYIPLEDSEHQNILAVFPRAINFIQKVRHSGGVLVHCMAGVSRSASLVLAYLMQRFRLPLEEAYRYVKGKKPNVNPNRGFAQQLREFQRQLSGDQQLARSRVGSVGHGSMYEQLKQRLTSIEERYRNILERRSEGKCSRVQSVQQLLRDSYTSRFRY